MAPPWSSIPAQGTKPIYLNYQKNKYLPGTIAKMLGDRTLADMKTPAPGTVYSESASTAPSHSVEKRQEQVSPAYRAAARSLDAELGSKPVSPGIVVSELNTYNSGNVLGLVAGAYAELTSAFHVTIDLVASQLADEDLQFFDIGHWMCKFISLQQVRRCPGLALQPRVGQTHARSLPGPRPASQPTPPHGDRGHR